MGGLLNKMLSREVIKFCQFIDSQDGVFCFYVFVPISGTFTRKFRL
jgi:hypothetical protein